MVLGCCALLSRSLCTILCSSSYTTFALLSTQSPPSLPPPPLLSLSLFYDVSIPSGSPPANEAAGMAGTAAAAAVAAATLRAPTCWGALPVLYQKARHASINSLSDGVGGVGWGGGGNCEGQDEEWVGGKERDENNVSTTHACVTSPSFFLSATPMMAVRAACAMSSPSVLDMLAAEIKPEWSAVVVVQWWWQSAEGEGE